MVIFIHLRLRKVQQPSDIEAVTLSIWLFDPKENGLYLSSETGLNMLLAFYANPDDSSTTTPFFV